MLIEAEKFRPPLADARGSVWVGRVCRHLQPLIPRAALVIALALAMALFGCKASSEFNNDIARDAIQSRPLTLEGEQVTLNQPEIDCGVQSDLWDAPASPSPERSSAHLTAKGRALNFNDDVIVREPNTRMPYVSIRGTFPLSVSEMVSTRDGDEKGTKVAEARVGVKID